MTMKRVHSFSLAVLFLSALALPVTSRAAEAEPAPWQSLFNGQDLKGWVPVHDVTFEAKDGHLRLVKGMGWLRTDKEFKDFVLEFEWRALEEQYDSGVFIRAGLAGKPWPTDGWQLNLRYNQLGALVKGYRTVVPAETPKAPVNQWVRFRVEVRGTKVKLSVDGEEAWESDKLDAQRGYIGIQAENKSFDFRNLRVQEL
jgi:hypothetical protein